MCLYVYLLICWFGSLVCLLCRSKVDRVFNQGKLKKITIQANVQKRFQLVMNKRTFLLSIDSFTALFSFIICVIAFFDVAFMLFCFLNPVFRVRSSLVLKNKMEM